MNISPGDIERVVREVLAEFGAAPMVKNQKREEGREKSDEGREKKDQQGLAASAASASDGDLVITSRVVSISDLLGRLDSVRRVIVSRRAIVTPAVRDELLRRGIALVHADSEDSGRPPVCLAMIASGTDFDAAPLAAALEREGVRVERSESDCLLAAVDELAVEIAGPNTLGVLLTAHAAAGLCLANRTAGVRAIGGADAAEAGRAAAAVGANLLVADPRAGTLFPVETDGRGVLPRRDPPLPGGVPRAVDVSGTKLMDGLKCELPT